MIRTRSAGRVVAVAALGLLATACGGSPAAPAPPPATATAGAAPATTTAAAAAGTAAAATTTAALPARCTTGELKGSIGQTGGAAGSVYVQLLLTNTGKRTCELTGFPGVSYVAGADGHQVGPAAARSGPPGTTVRLAPGQAAAAQVQLVDVQNYDAAVCRPTEVRGLRVYPPGDTASLFVPRPGTGCAGTPPGDQLSVQAVRPAAG